ncbi:MAG: hypothetical protein ACREUC_08820 [Steroidobacteraceae bacterium]
MNLHFNRRYGSHLAACAAIALGACGGGGDSSSGSSHAVAASRPVEQSDLQIAQNLYAGSPRTPQGFYADPLPNGHEYVSTAHLKNGDITQLTAAEPLYELCTNDWNQALAWSESSAQSAPQYADLVETNDDVRYFEFGRVRQGNPAFYVRARVFKCAYLDRSAANLRAVEGEAGHFNQRPLTAADLRNLSEYLWHFTLYNNVGYVVLKSGSTSAQGELTHTLHIGSLVRNAISPSCDRIDVLAWQHRLDMATGRLQLDVQTLWSFGARESGAVAALCSG